MLTCMRTWTCALTHMCPHAHAHTLARALAHGEKGVRGPHGRAARPGRRRVALARHREIQAIARSVPHRPIGSALLSVPLKRPLHLDHLQSEKCNPRWHFWPHLVPQLYLEQTGAFLGPRGVRVARDGETDHRGRVLPDSHPWPNEPRRLRHGPGVRLRQAGLRRGSFSRRPRSVCGHASAPAHASPAPPRPGSCS